MKDFATVVQEFGATSADAYWDYEFLTSAEHGDPATREAYQAVLDAYATLKARCVAAEQDAALCWGTLYEIRDVLIQVLGEEAMRSTPPMMYPEAIASALYSVRQEAYLERRN